MPRAGVSRGRRAANCRELSRALVQIRGRETNDAVVTYIVQIHDEYVISQGLGRHSILHSPKQCLILSDVTTPKSARERARGIARRRHDNAADDDEGGSAWTETNVIDNVSRVRGANGVGARDDGAMRGVEV